jgi:hypothetical protein
MDSGPRRLNPPEQGVSRPTPECPTMSKSGRFSFAELRRAYRLVHEYRDLQIQPREPVARLTQP